MIWKRDPIRLWRCSSRCFWRCSCSRAPWAAAPASAEPIPESGAVLILEDTAVPMGDLPETGTAAAENMDPVQLLGMAAVCFSLAAAGLALTIHHKNHQK